MEINQNYYSLYEYLGKAAGSELGLRVAQRAKAENIRVTSHQVSNPKYKGPILKYPKAFLDSFFADEYISQLNNI